MFGRRSHVKKAVRIVRPDCGESIVALERGGLDAIHDDFVAVCNRSPAAKVDRGPGVLQKNPFCHKCHRRQDHVGNRPKTASIGFEIRLRASGEYPISRIRRPPAIPFGLMPAGCESTSTVMILPRARDCVTMSGA